MFELGVVHRQITRADRQTAAALAASAQAMAAASFPGPTPPQDLARRCAEIIGGFAATV